MHVGEPQVAAAVPIRQPGVIESQQVQRGGIQVVNMDPIFHRFETEFRPLRR
jgi:hypothetical protein